MTSLILATLNFLLSNLSSEWKIGSNQIRPSNHHTSIFYKNIAILITCVVKSSDRSQQREFFLPHHGVIRETSSTTKFRVIFNGSQKTNLNFSLNDVLHIGPKLQTDLNASSLVGVDINTYSLPTLKKCIGKSMFMRMTGHYNRFFGETSLTKLFKNTNYAPFRTV